MSRLVGCLPPGLARFTLLAVLYAAPWLLSVSTDLGSDDGTRQALWAAMASPVVVAGVTLNLAVHLGLLLALYAAVAWLSARLALACRLAPGLLFATVLLAAWVWLVSGNGLVFSHSRYSVPFDVLVRPQWFAAASVALAGMLGVVSWRARPTAWPMRWWLGTAGVALAALALAAWPNRPAEAGPPPVAARNIIIIGIDSLSAPLLQAERQRLPHLSTLLAQAASYPRAHTPLGRTYPAWVSILSGQAPAVHGALFNLRGLEQANRDDLITHALRARGYRTIYAIDERRFNNIDESFGFDEVIGPRAGALDFAVQGLNDTPLTNLLLQTRAAHWLLPYSHLNVAAHASYDANGFVDAIERSSAQTRGPLFLAVHFLSGHFPFKTRHATGRYPDPGNALRSHHIETLTAVDGQVGRLMRALRDQGRLDDALVIVLSDHGEALGGDEPIRLTNGELVNMSSFGHGADLLSEHQNHIVLAMARFRNGQAIPPDGATRREQVSLLDVRPTIERLVRDGVAELKPSTDCIHVETELRLASVADYRHLDTRKVAAEGMGLYEIDDKGRLRLREAFVAALVAKKDVGLRCADRLTIYKPSERAYRAYRLAPEQPPQETRPLAEDIARIEAYRRSLLEAGAGASAEARRKPAG